MEWDREKTVELIDKYRNEECLWNVRSTLYKDKKRKQDAWNNLATEFGVPVAEVQSKIRNLKVQWNAEKKVEKSMRSGASNSEIHIPKWFAYKPLMFLVDVVERRDTQSNLASTTSSFRAQKIA